MKAYAIRKKGTEEYLLASARFGPLEEAWIYHDLAKARDEAYPEDELVGVAFVVVRVVDPTEPA